MILVDDINLRHLKNMDHFFHLHVEQKKCQLFFFPQVIWTHVSIHQKWPVDPMSSHAFIITKVDQRSGLLYEDINNFNAVVTRKQLTTVGIYENGYFLFMRMAIFIYKNGYFKRLIEE